MTDYYKLLGIESSASSEEIQAAIKKTRRTWNNRANNPDAKIRSEAEQHVKEVADAEKILLSASDRRQYDQELISYQNTSNQERALDDDFDWDDKILAMVAIGNTSNAYASLQTILQTKPKDPRALFLMGLVCGDMGRDDEAIEYLTAATIVDSSNPQVFKQLGLAYDGNDAVKALEAFQKAARLDPDEDLYELYSSVELMVMERYKEAYDMAKPAYQRHKDDANYQEEYWKVLLRYAKSCVSRNTATDRPLITNQRQLIMIKSMESDIREVKSARKDLNQLAEALLAAISEAETKRVGKSMGTIVFMGILAFIIGLFSGGSGGLVGFLIGAVVIGGYYVSQSKPGYVRNYAEASDATRRTGLQ